MTERATIKEPITLKGYDLWSFSDNLAASIQPHRSGIEFVIGSIIVPFDIAHIEGVTGMVGERYVRVVSQGTEVRVVEHLASALHLAGITDARVVMSDGARSVPQRGAGIEAMYRLLRSQRQVTDDVPREVKVVKSSTYEFFNKRIGDMTSVCAYPSDSLDITVLAARQPDLCALGEKPLQVNAVYAGCEQHLSARPLARLATRIFHTHPIYALWRAARAVGYRGISEENYVLVTPQDTPQTVCGKMQPCYREDMNEFLAHTLFCDFPGELYAIGNCQIKGGFTLKNSNHLTRIDALRQFVKEGVFSLVDG